ncbi:MAG: alpha/beta hydrolase [Clostridium sp.]|nr:alpha/beta hydrolase [Bacteroides sp.]MCM1199271.1 alpha/beta hydrolase [Clostridium sp.]
MKKTLTIMAAGLLAYTAALAQPGIRLKPDETVLLYSGSMTENTDPVTAKKITAAGFKMKESNGLTGAENIPESGNIGNINADARFDLYFPKKPNGQMVVVCPGGGYSIVSSYNEGLYVADWMLSKGITVAVVKYRLPNGHREVPLADVQNTFRYCREHAAEWGVDQIGVMGFSAGGHLAATTLTMYSDAATRPDFGVLIYPVISFDMKITHKGTHNQLIGTEADMTGRNGRTWEEWDRACRRYKALEKTYSLENQVSPDMPATFIALSNDDRTVPAQNSILFYDAMLRNNVPAELHIYPSGGHGWGFSKDEYVGKGNDRIGYCRKEFESSLERWLSSVR